VLHHAFIVKDSSAPLQDRKFYQLEDKIGPLPSKALTASTLKKLASSLSLRYSLWSVWWTLQKARN
jgi:hypothetical protein